MSRVFKIYFRLRRKPIKRTRRVSREYLENKEKALFLAKERLNYFNDFYHFKWNNVTIKNQKTRWGSCSRKGNINFNYRIATIPQKYSDYIIVHELCHLEEFNHSDKFWNLVSKTIPGWKEIRKNLRKNSLSVN